MKNTKKNPDNYKGIIELSERFPDENSARKYFEQIRWNGQPVCPHCYNPKRKIYTFEKRNLYKCSGCKKQFTVTVGTVFEGSKVSLRKWIFAMYLIGNTSKGVSSMYLAKTIGLTQKSAWFVLHRLRYAIRTNNFWTAAPLTGTVECDETYLGGKEYNKHANKKGLPRKDKTIVFGALQRGGKVRAEVIQYNSDGALPKHIIQPIVQENVKEGSLLITDSATGYIGMGRHYQHEVVSHSTGEYVRGNFHTNGIENFWSIMKRGIIGVYHSISPKHTNKYIDEYEYRYNTRESNDKSRIDLVLTNSVGRLTYKQLIQK